MTEHEVHFCTSCGGLLTDGARFCASCGAATDGTAERPRYHKTTRELSTDFASAETRKAVLDAEVNRYRAKGWKTFSQSETKARLYRGRRELLDLEVGLDGSLSETPVEGTAPHEDHKVRTGLPIIGGVIGVIVLLGIIGSSATTAQNSTSSSAPSSAPAS
jgi:hypothetical protein